jgi:hypothetical protein
MKEKMGIDKIIKRESMEMENGTYKIYRRDKVTGEKILVGIAEIAAVPGKKPKKERILKVV